MACGKENWEAQGKKQAHQMKPIEVLGGIKMINDVTDFLRVQVVDLQMTLSQLQELLE